ncbi:MAG: hypothetical protein ACRC7O_10570, partial [Fimbriiglobus sp.]
PNGHPEFRAVSPKTEAEKHRRTLKFSHAVHMAAGMNVGTGYRFADIPDAADRTRYMALLGETDPNAPVKLNCAACHRLDPARPDGAAGKLTAAEEFSRDTRLTLLGLPKDAIQPARPAGAVFLPVVFESDCRACHPLTFDESAGLRDRHAPHRVQPADLDRFLHEVYAARYVADQLKPPPEVDRGPGRLDPRPGDLDPDAKALARKKIGEQVNRAKEMLFAGRRTCLECHYAEFPAPSVADETTKFPTKILPATVPPVWLPRARFDHTAHRATKCADCHPASYSGVDAERAAAAKYAAPTATEPRYQHPPDIPGMANCVQCHSPGGGVRHGCTDCHGYHAADRWLQGRGSPLHRAK